MPLPDFTGTDRYYWVGSADTGLAHLARHSPYGPAQRAVCVTVFVDPPETHLARDKARCGICKDWVADHPKAHIIDYGAL